MPHFIPLFQFPSVFNQIFVATHKVPLQIRRNDTWLKQDANPGHGEVLLKSFAWKANGLSNPTQASKQPGAVPSPPFILGAGHERRSNLQV